MGKIIREKKAQEFMRFCCVGVVAAGIHYAVYYAIQLMATSGFWLNMAYSTGYVVSLICNFFMTTYFTFRSKASVKRMAGFGGSHLVNYLIHIVLFNVFIALNVHRLMAPILVLMVAVPTNFTILRWVYGRK
ncbi:MAG: GtrA family protein [Prevotella sp.]